MQIIDVASIVLVNPDGKLVFQKRDDKPGIRNPNKVTAWGGACEGAETPLQAAVREMHEETNLRPTELDFEFFGTYPRDDYIDGRQVVNHVFLLKDINAATLEVYEGQGFVVVDPDVDASDPSYTNLTCELIRDYASR